MNAALRMYGYASYDAVQFFDTIDLATETKQQANEIPLMRYRLYQYVLAINHFKDELVICENVIDGLDSCLEEVESIIRNKDIPVFPFQFSSGQPLFLHQMPATIHT